MKIKKNDTQKMLSALCKDKSISLTPATILLKPISSLPSIFPETVDLKNVLGKIFLGLPCGKTFAALQDKLSKSLSLLW